MSTATPADGGATPVDIDPKSMRSVLGRHPTGVAVVTSLSDSGKTLALIVGSFTSVSLSPPLVGFFPDKRSTTWPQIERTGRFVASTLALDQRDVCDALSGREKALGDVAWVNTQSGLPYPRSALATFECDIFNVVEAGDHWFVMGRVVELEAHRDGPPLVFWNGELGWGA
jgi:flavin reductase (DIM6/NTAB) family NADH-FMN oxidoreductase RutF